MASSSVLDARGAAANEMRLLLLLPSRRPAMLAAGAVKVPPQRPGLWSFAAAPLIDRYSSSVHGQVLLRCCDALNESLKLSSLHALALLLTGAQMAVEAAASAPPSECAEEGAAADASRATASTQLAELGGAAVSPYGRTRLPPTGSFAALPLMERRSSPCVDRF